MRPRQGSIRQLIAYSDELCDKGDPQSAHDVLVDAALAEPLDAPELLAELRATQRATRADRVTARLSRSPIQLRTVVAMALLDARGEPDCTTLLKSICAENDDDVITALILFTGTSTYAAESQDEAWRPQGDYLGDAAAGALCARLLRGPAARYECLLARLYEVGLATVAEYATRQFAAARPLRAIELAVEFDRCGLRQGAESLVANIVLRHSPCTLVEILGMLEPETRRLIDPLVLSTMIQHPESRALVDALRQCETSQLADRFLHTVADSAPALTIAALHDALLVLHAHDDANVVISRAAARADAAELCSALHRASRHRIAHLVAEQRTQARTPGAS